MTSVTFPSVFHASTVSVTLENQLVVAYFLFSPALFSPLHIYTKPFREQLAEQNQASLMSVQSVKHVN